MGDNETSTWSKYGSSAAASPVITGFGAVSIADLVKMNACSDYVALKPHIIKAARSPDLYALVLLCDDASTAGGEAASIADIAERLQLFWQLDCCPKPIVALIGGTLGAAALGVAAYTTHRVAGDDYGFVLPGIQPLPLCGIAPQLAQLDAKLGIDLIESGRRVGRAEAYAAGLVTHCIPTASFPAIIAALADGQPIDPLLDNLHQDPGPPPVASSNGATVMRPDTAPFGAAITRHQLQMRLLQTARQSDVREALIATFRLAHNIADFGGVDKTSIDAFFSVPKSGDLILPLRSELENGRF